MIKTAVLLPAGTRVQPEEILIDNYKDIQTQVGGPFDVVSLDVKGEMGRIALAGYVNDEGLLTGMEVNYLATMLFGRELVGPCVVTWGLSPNGEYDGDDYDMPENIMAWMKDRLTHTVAEAYNQATLLAWVTAQLVEEGEVTEEEVEHALASFDDYALGGELTAETELFLIKVNAYVKELDARLTDRIMDAIQGIVSEEMGEDDE